jgi:DNA-binding IclR family transcriptional regulator
MSRREPQAGVAAVDRALAILAAFGVNDAALSLAELAQRTGLYKSTILRLAVSLENAGYLVRMENGHWRLGSTVFKLGAAYQHAFQLSDYVRPILEQVAAASQESVAFYIRERNVRVCLFRIDGMHAVRHHVRVGEQLPLDRGGPARIIRAFTGGEDKVSAQVRQDLYFVSHGERDPHAVSISVPVFDVRGGLTGALAITGPAGRFTRKRVASHIKLALQAAATLTRQLGGDASTLQHALKSKSWLKQE